MPAIRDLIGEERLNAALRRLLAENSGGSSATTQQLLRQLQAASTKKEFANIALWMDQIALYDAERRTQKLRKEPTTNTCGT